MDEEAPSQVLHPSLPSPSSWPQPQSKLYKSIIYLSEVTIIASSRKVEGCMLDPTHQHHASLRNGWQPAEQPIPSY